MPNCQEQQGESSEQILFLPMRECIKEYHVQKWWVNIFNNNLLIIIYVFYNIFSTLMKVFKIRVYLTFFLHVVKISFSKDNYVCMAIWSVVTLLDLHCYSK